MVRSERDYEARSYLNIWSSFCILLVERWKRFSLNIGTRAWRPWPWPTNEYPIMKTGTSGMASLTLSMCWNTSFVKMLNLETLVRSPWLLPCPTGRYANDNVEPGIFPDSNNLWTNVGTTVPTLGQCWVHLHCCVGFPNSRCPGKTTKHISAYCR